MDQRVLDDTCGSMRPAHEQLKDLQIKVIGVVPVKIINENLNYALPISEVLNTPKNKALMDKRIACSVVVFDTTLNNTFKGHFALPESLPAFNSTASAASRSDFTRAS